MLQFCDEPSFEEQVDIFYFTSWQSPMINYSFIENGKADVNWQFQTSASTKKRQVSYFRISSKKQRSVIFVLCNQEKNSWDHPHFEKDQQNIYKTEFLNYRIDGVGSFAILRGKVIRIQNIEKDAVLIQQYLQQQQSPPNQSLSHRGQQQQNVYKQQQQQQKQIDVTYMAFDTEYQKQQKQQNSKYLFSVDFDGTLVGNSEQLEEFNHFWIQNFYFTHHPKIVYNTGRSIQELLSTKAEVIWPDHLVVSSGTQIYSYDYISQQYKLDSQWNAIITQNWNQQIIQQVTLQLLDWMRLQNKNVGLPHEGYYNGTIFGGWAYANKIALQELQAILVKLKTEHNIYAKFAICGKGEAKFIDIFPERAGKGLAMNFLASILGINDEFVYAFGNSTNDIEMLTAAKGGGIIVSNMEDDLKELYQLKKQRGDQDMTNLEVSLYSFAEAIKNKIAILMNYDKKQENQNIQQIHLLQQIPKIQ